MTAAHHPDGDHELPPLDPADWEAFRALAHRMVDDSIDFLRDVRERPAWQPLPDTVRDRILHEPMPRAGQGDAAAYEDFLHLVRPYPNGNIHPRSWGWVMGNGTPQSAMADFLASVLNPNVGGFEQAPKYVEQVVIRWLAEAMGYPAGAGGILLSGGTLANVIGLAVARHRRAGFDVQRSGGHGAGEPRVMIYASTEVHGWLTKACDLLGLGRDAFRQVPVGEDYRVDVAAIARMIAEDRAAGHQPCCIIGTAGTVQTGATDDLEALADLAAREGCWFHVDGAFGALAALSPETAPVVRGMPRADSIAFDLHKWGYLPFGVACVLTRADADLVGTFAMQAAYLTRESRGVAGGSTIYFADRGIELSRRFSALKVWMSLKASGLDLLGAHIARNVRQAAGLAARVAAAPDLELLAPAPLNIVNFRYAPAGVATERLDALNREILLRLQERGIAVPSGTTIRGRYAIRVAITNHRSTDADFSALIDGVRAIGTELTSPVS
jgi:glutamate/tyrosine decarboxylase-like PLP-dependent enzyme